MKQTNINKLGQKIAQIRESFGLNQRQLAKKMSVPQSTISRIESGEQNISYAILEKVCLALDLEIDLVAKNTTNFDAQNKYIKIKQGLIELLENN